MGKLAFSFVNGVKRFYSVESSKKYFVSTPIFYVNASPHIGHLYSGVVADAVQRWRRLVDRDVTVIFSTGTDEHGSKIQQAAVQNNSALDVYCTNVSNAYREIFNQCAVQYTSFVRTTSERHRDAVHHFWKQLDRNGHIYSAKYSGWYCVPDETFLTESQLRDTVTADGRKVKVSLDSGHPVEWTEEQNYMFRLSHFRDDLIHWLKSNEDVVQPKKFHRMVLEWLTMDGSMHDTIPDLSISRPRSRVHWAIPVPGDREQTVYVWLDALVNYLTVAGYHQHMDARLDTTQPSAAGSDFHACWPPDVHVVGKDILKFHAIYWPAFLMGAGLEPPRRIFCHSHWTVDGEKMSKSKGNVVRPVDRFEQYTAEGLRYFLLREGVAHSDGNYSDVKVMRILNAELADTFGNLLSRCCGKALNGKQTFPALDSRAFADLNQHDVTRKLIHMLEALPDKVQEDYNTFNFYKVVDSVVATLHAANLFFETMKPWELRKAAQKAQDNNNGKMNEAQVQLDAVIHLTMETLRVISIILQPIIPNLCDRILTKLDVDSCARFWSDLRPMSWERMPVSERCLTESTAIIFQRIKDPVNEPEKKSSRRGKN